MKANYSTSHYSEVVQPHTAISWLAKSQGPRPKLATELGKSSQQKHITHILMTLIVKFDSVFMKLCVCEDWFS